MLSRPDDGGRCHGRRGLPRPYAPVPVPHDQTRDIVIADNLSSRKVAGVRRTIEAAGASFRHLPPYSPDFNPIENLFAKLKALLKKAAHRIVAALWQEIRQPA
jgi:transposase